MENGDIFIRTDQLDGETDWKLRRAISATQTHFTTHRTFESMPGAYIKAEPPMLHIYQFKGKFYGGAEEENEGDERLTLENTLWSNTVLASSGYIYGLAVYTGKETRAQMNSKMPGSKVGLLDLEINFLSKVLFLFLMGIAAVIVLLNGFNSNWYLMYFRYVLLLSSIIPISLRVNLDMAKIYYSYGIQNDKSIEGTIPRNSTIPEELGRIQYLLSDKTGTLTRNEMLFKKLAMEYATFSDESLQDIALILEECCKNDDSPAIDLFKRLSEVDVAMRHGTIAGKQRKKKRREQEKVVRDVITALILCHNVTPVTNNEGERELQASSPDEVALVKFAEELGYLLISRTQQEIIIRNKVGEIEEYDILQCFPFSSESKRMGIILRYRKNGLILFYLKGAEVILASKI